MTRWFCLVVLLLPMAAWSAALPDFTELVKDNAPAVVNISTKAKSSIQERMGIPHGAPGNDMLEEFMRRFFGELPEGGQFETESLGSGFVISKDGYIVTNHHVVEGAEEIIVRFHDRGEKVAKLIGSDKRTDVALLKVDAKDLPVLLLGNPDDVPVGSWVVAIGSPFGFDHSVTAGIVSAKGRSLPDENYVPFIQTDVAINPGNSGGPLFNLDGEVIGINSQIYSRSGGFMGLSFAIPTDVAMNVVEQLKSDGRVQRGWLGVYIQEITRDLAETFGLDRPRGALVADVVGDSPAGKGGIQVGDVILSFNGHEIQRSSDLPPLVGVTPIGQSVPVVVMREGNNKTLKIRIAELPEEEAIAEAPIQVLPEDTSVLGMELSNPTPARLENLGLKNGVLIDQVKDDPAASAGLRPGDVITMMDGQSIRSVEQFSDMAGKIRAGRSVSVLVHRDGGPVFLALRIPES